MFIYCSKCKYDSGDRDSMQELADKLELDGGEAYFTKDGWQFECPNCKSDQHIHVD